MTPKLYGYNTCPVEIKDLIGKIVESFKSILKDNLVGIYLHGSLAMNCFNPKSGDIDFLAVVKEKLGIKTKKINRSNSGNLETRTFTQKRI